MSIFEGAGVALVTPFHEDGSVNYEKLEQIVEEQIAGGTDCIIACGTTGEAATLSHEEHIEVIRFVCQVVNKRIPVVAGTGSNCTETAVYLSTEAKKAGADGLLLVSPYYNKSTQKGLKVHFSEVAKAVDLPILLYNVPSRTGVNITPETIVALCKEYENIVGVKEASGNFSAIAQIASSQYGGQSISLAHLVPFVQISREKIHAELLQTLKESGVELSEEKINSIVERRLHAEIERGVQVIQYQVVTLMTTNGQSPFVTVFMYLNEAKNEQEKKDLAMIIEEVLDQRYQGVKNEDGVWITPAFPKLIYVLEEDNIHEDSEYYYLTKKAAKCTAKRMVPDYISAKIMKELKNGDVYPCMGCRSFLTVEDSQRNADGSHKFYGRFNQGVVTINLVDVACSAEGNMERFWEILDERLELCHRALRCRHERLLGTVSDVAPILWQNGALARLKKGETIDKLLFDGYSTISLGYAGLYEMCMRMLGKSHTDPEAKPFALAVMQRLNDKCKEWKEAENISYSVYGTPMESTTYKFAKCLQKRFGIIPGVTDKNYITNSYHVHVTEKIDAFSKLKFESEFQKLSPGGAISYIEVPNMQTNIPAVLSVLQYIYENIMYAELNTKSDFCEVCGYDGEIKIIEDETGKLVWECPNCGNRDQDKLFVARRTCGYIGTQFWNQGRTQEIKDRVLHL